MWKRIRPMLPHAAIVLANMFLVFFAIDRVNTSMNFIDNDLTKYVLLAMSALAIVDWRVWRKRPRRGATGRKAAAKTAAKQPAATAKATSTKPAATRAAKQPAASAKPAAAKPAAAARKPAAAKTAAARPGQKRSAT